MSNDNVDAEIGPPVLVFPDPAAFGWAAVVLGVALTIVGALVVTLILVEGRGGASTEDFLAGCGLGAMCLLSGVVFTALAALDMWRKPAWHFSTRGFVRMTKSGPARRAFWRDIARLEIVHVQRPGGRTTGYWLRGGSRRIRVPNVTIAQRGYDLWRSARA